MQKSAVNLTIILLVAVILVAGCVGQAPASDQNTGQNSNQQSGQQTGSQTGQQTATKNYVIKQETPPITLPPIVESTISTVADCYAAETGKSITITSGTRTPEEQARAMYTMLKGGDRLGVYVNQVAAGEIRDAYDAGVAAGEDDEDIIQDMTWVIEDQVYDEVYISSHLVAGATDVRITDMTEAEKNIFRGCANSTPGVRRVINESTPPHWHLEINTNVQPTPTPTPTPTPSPTPTRFANVTVDSTECVITSTDRFGDRHYILRASGTARGSEGAELQLTMNPGYYPVSTCSAWGPSDLQTCARGNGPETTSWSFETEADDIIEGFTLKLVDYAIDVQVRIFFGTGLAAEKVVAVQCPQ